MVFKGIFRQYLSTSRILWSKENISREDEFERLMSRSRKPAPRKRRPIAASYSKTVGITSVVVVYLFVYACRYGNRRSSA